MILIPSSFTVERKMKSMLTNLNRLASVIGGERCNLPLALLKVNYTVVTDKAVTADNCANTRNRKVL